MINGFIKAFIYFNHTLISFRLISIGSGASETLFVMVKSLVLLAILGNKNIFRILTFAIKSIG